MTSTIAIKFLSIMQDTINSFEDNYTRAMQKRGKEIITEEEKADGIIEDRKMQIDRELKIHYIRSIIA